MRNRSRKSNRNEISTAVVEAIASGELPMTVDGKNPFAVALGRRGGLKGGPARAAKMTGKQLSESARKAAVARWSKSTPSQPAKARS